MNRYNLFSPPTSFWKVRLILIGFVLCGVPFLAQAKIYLPGETLDPNCQPSEVNCTVATSTPTAVAGYFTATSTTATSTLPILNVTNRLIIDSLNGFLFATNGLVTATSSLGSVNVTNSTTTNQYTTNNITENATTTNEITENSTTTNQYTENATIENLAVTGTSTLATTSVSELTIDSLNGFLFATNGLVSATSSPESVTTNSFFATSTTIVNATTTNSYTTNNVSENSTTTNLAAENSTTTNAFIQNLTIDNLTGVLKAVSGSVTAGLVDLASEITGVLAIGNGGTGTSTAPTTGQLLVGNAAGGYNLVATSTLGLQTALVGTEGQSLKFDSLGMPVATSDIFFGPFGDIGIGTEAPLTRLHVSDNTVSYAVGQVLVTGSSDPNEFITLGFNTSLDHGFVQAGVHGGGTKNIIFNPLGGNIGIGTVTPTSKLDVTGTTTLDTLVLGNLTGVLKAATGVVSAGLVNLPSEVAGVLGVGNGGTGRATVPLQSQLLVGNATGGYDLVATSSLGLSITDTVGTLPVNRGGTGREYFAANAVLLGNTNGPLATTSRGDLLTGTGLSISGIGTDSILGNNLTLALDIAGLTEGTAIATDDHLAIYDTSLGGIRKISRNNFLQGVTGSMQYQGVWDPITNTPALSDGTGTQGYVYAVATSSTVDIGSGPINFLQGDLVIHNGSGWERAPSGHFVHAVFGRTGSVTAQPGDYDAGQITFIATSTLTSTDTQGAIEELLFEKMGSFNGLAATEQFFANDTNVTITSSGDTHTLGWTGLLSAARGGTGIGTLTPNRLLLTNAAGNGYVQVATSTLGLQTALVGTEGQTLTFNALGNPIATSLLFFAQNGNVGIGNTAPASKFTVGADLAHDGSFDYSTAQMTIFDPVHNGGNTPSTTRDILHLAREGVTSQSYGNRASFAIGRYEDVGTNSRTQLDIKLAEGQFSSNTVMSLRSNGNVGIGTTTPTSKLQVVGITTLDTLALGNLTGFLNATNGLVTATSSLGSVSVTNATTTNSYTTNNVSENSTTTNLIAENSTTTNGYLENLVAENSTTTNAFIQNLTIDNLTGVLKAVSGSVTAGLVDLASEITGVLAIGNGGTGTSTAPTAGQLLVGNASGGYDLAATSTLGLQAALSGTEGQSLMFNASGTPVATSNLFFGSSGNIGIGTTTPESGFTVAGKTLLHDTLALVKGIRDNIFSFGKSGQVLTSTGGGVEWKHTVALAGGGSGTTTVDSSPDNVGQYTSIAIGTDGSPVISYYDVTNGDLKVATCDSTDCSSDTTLATVDSVGIVGYGAAMAIGIDGFPVITYQDLSNEDLKVAKCGSKDCSSGNIVTTVIFDGASSTTSAAFPTIAIGADGLPVISYFEGENADLVVAKCGSADCSTATHTIVDSGGNVGGSSAITIGHNGFPVIAYKDATNSDLKVATCGSADCSSGNTIATVDSTQPYDIDIAISADGLPVISYTTSPTTLNFDLKVAKCGSTDCTSGNTFTIVDSEGSAGLSPSVTIGADGLPIISYVDSANSALKVAKCNSADCSASTLTIVDSAGQVGTFNSIAIGADGLPVISYYDATNQDLKVTKCADSACAKTGGTGSGSALALNELFDATGSGVIEAFNYDQHWRWSTLATGTALALNANSLTTGSILSLTSDSGALDSVHGLLHVTNTGTSTSGLLASMVASSTGNGFYVTNTGNVGIGTSTPSSALTVAGTTTVENLKISSLTGVLKATAGVVSTGLVDLASEITGVLAIGNGGTGTSTAPTTGQLLIGNAAGGYDLAATSTLGLQTALVGTEGQTLTFNASGTPMTTSSLFIAQSGNVGVGTTNPEHKLDVLGAVSATPITNGILRIVGTGTNPATGSGGGLLFAQQSSSGSHSPYASITGRRVNQLINNRVDLDFNTGSASDGNPLATRMTITSAGRVGIGTTAPLAKLTVDASAEGGTTGQTILQTIGSDNSFLMNSIQNTSTSTGASSDWVAIADNGTAFSHYIDMGINGSGGGIAPFTAPNDGYLYTIDDDLNIGALGATANLMFHTTGGGAPRERMRITDFGNVGIGNTAPASKLTIGADLAHDNFFDYSTAQMTIFDSVHNGGNIPTTTRDILHLAREGVASQSYANRASFALGRYENAGTNSRTQLDIKLAEGAFSSNTVMSLRSNGNVGIGTAAPAKKLVVQTGDNDALRIRSSESTDAILEFSHPLSEADDVTKTAIVSDALNSWKRSDLRFVLNSVTASTNYDIAADTKMIIKNNGNVGIGITTPDWKLQANDAVLATMGVSSGKFANLYAGSGYSGLNFDETGFLTISPGDATNDINTNGLTVVGSGNVGIGTTNASNRLTVHGTNSDTVPILALLSGNNGASFNDGAQIAFGYGGAPIHQHFIHTRHNSSNSNNAIDFYVSDGTANNSVATGSIHTMSLVSGNVGIGTVAPGNKLSVVSAGTGVVARFTNANGSCDVDPTAGSLVCTSDDTLKKNEVTLNTTLTDVLALNPISFDWNGEADGAGNHIGFLAQEVEALFPELVSTDVDGKKAIAYSNFAPILVRAMQEQFGGLQGIEFTAHTNYEDIFASEISLDELESADAGEYLTADTPTYLRERVEAGIKIVRTLVAERIVAIEGYFKRIFANELCLTDDDGTYVCVTGESLKDLQDSKVATSTPDNATNTDNDQTDNNDNGNQNEADADITLSVNGDNPTVIEVDETYSDEGATASSSQQELLALGVKTFQPNDNGDLVEVLDVQIDTSTTSVYTITYRVIDDAGETLAEATRTVEVTDSTSNGGNGGNGGSDSSDNNGGGDGDTDNSAGDQNGNQNSPNPDETAPAITITDGDTVILTEGDAYTDAGATAWDEVDGDLTSNIDTTGTVDADTAGTYTITYTVSDTAGNEATADLTVTVEPAPEPLTCVAPEELNSTGDACIAPNPAPEGGGGDGAPSGGEEGTGDTS